jgi:large subunit ribosomal protein L25
MRVGCQRAVFGERKKETAAMSIDRSTLDAKVREGSGKGPARRLRLQGVVPAVVYGRHLEKPVSISVDPIAIKRAIATPHKFNTLIALKVEGGAEHQVLLKDYQQDPVTRDVLHADFIAVREDEQVKVNIPVALIGKPVGVAEGGILSQARRELEVWALPRAIPEKIEVDVSALKIAQALHVNDITFPQGITVKTHVNFTIAVVTAPEKEEVVVVAPTAAAAVPGAPGAPGAAGAAPGAAGAAPAAGAAAAAPDKAGAAAPAGKKEAGGKKDDKKK